MGWDNWRRWCAAPKEGKAQTERKVREVVVTITFAQACAKAAANDDAGSFL